VDSGASVCITPHRSDFLSYQSSSMIIKDLSSSNSVAGEGIVRWSFQGANGKSFSIEVVGYHIPTAEVRLLSPQVLLQTVGGHAFQHAQGIDFLVDNGFQMSAVLCPHSNLSLLSLALPNQEHFSFWDEAFGYSPTCKLLIRSNLSSALTTQICLALKRSSFSGTKNCLTPRSIGYKC
jgi:hypothetical protein